MTHYWVWLSSSEILKKSQVRLPMEEFSGPFSQMQIVLPLVFHWCESSFHFQAGFPYVIYLYQVSLSREGIYSPSYQTESVPLPKSLSSWFFSTTKHDLHVLSGPFQVDLQRNLFFSPKTVLPPKSSPNFCVPPPGLMFLLSLFHLRLFYWERLSCPYYQIQSVPPSKSSSSFQVPMPWMISLICLATSQVYLQRDGCQLFLLNTYNTTSKDFLQAPFMFYHRSRLVWFLLPRLRFFFWNNDFFGPSYQTVKAQSLPPSCFHIPAPYVNYLMSLTHFNFHYRTQLSGHSSNADRATSKVFLQVAFLQDWPPTSHSIPPPCLTSMNLYKHFRLVCQEMVFLVSPINHR